MQGFLFQEIMCKTEKSCAEKFRAGKFRAYKRRFREWKFRAWNLVHGKFRAKEISCMNRNFVHGDFVHTNKNNNFTRFSDSN